jgi:hypothetical protein
VSDITPNFHAVEVRLCASVVEDAVEEDPPHASKTDVSATAPAAPAAVRVMNCLLLTPVDFGRSFSSFCGMAVSLSV